ncbi:signal recognition particle receptor subunit alpha, partial [Candidatus Woesearchaeota archaeon]|nr:signal recognition particle receptor subunit alpha [Candidatus Woesearchaeota archaeon]
MEKVKEKVTTKIISESQFEEIFQDLQLILLENNVALNVVDKIKTDLKKELMEKPIKRMQIEEQIREALKNSLEDILTPPEFNLLKIIDNAKKESRPAVVLVIGYNGAGKSLTTAKLAYHLKQKGYNPILAAGDTFRAAGAVQLVEYGKIANIPVIHDHKTKDSCSVIFDTIKHAKSKHYDLVIADTSGRIQNNKDLMDELKKISRVNNPDATILVVDSLTGSDVVI